MSNSFDEVREEPDECSICGRPMGIFPDDQPDWPTGPMCGECYQSRQMDDELWAAEEQGETEGWP